MVRFSILLVFISSASSSFAQDPISADPAVVLEGLNTQLKDQSQKLSARIAECEAIMQCIQNGAPIQIASESAPIPKMHLPYWVPATGPKPESLDKLEFRMPAIHIDDKQDKVFLEQADDLPSFIRRYC